MDLFYTNLVGNGITATEKGVMFLLSPLLIVSCQLQKQDLTVKQDEFCIAFEIVG